MSSPYSPTHGLSTEIESAVQLAKKLRDDFQSLNTSAGSISSYELDSTHDSEISAIKTKSALLVNAYNDYLGKISLSGVTESRVRIDGLKSMLASFVEDHDSSTNKVNVYTAFLAALTISRGVVLKDLDEIQTWQKDTVALSTLYTNLIRAVLAEKKVIVKSAEEEISKTKVKIAELQEELSKLSSKKTKSLWGTSTDDSAEKEAEINAQVAKLKRSIIKLNSNITDADQIIDKYSSKSEEFRKSSDSASVAIGRVLVKLRSTMNQVFDQLKKDADFFRAALNHLPVNEGDVAKAKTHWETVDDAFDALANVQY